MAGFNKQFDRHSAWRREMALRLKLLVDWLQEQQLLDAAASESAQALIEQLRADKLMVAFVAEFSRGKSELINAVFFAAYGRRIMPASAGRTTMCPTELGFEAEVPPCLRLLPIETRLQPQALMEWRAVPEKWTRVDLDVNDPQQLAEAMEKVAEVNRVSVDEARALGFWNDEETEANPPVDEDGKVDVPRWRHALINMAHPLLKQGLVVLDTPGLNAIGTEPELTVNLIPQAQAAVFVLGADTGVTRSDLAIWREHLAPAHGAGNTSLAVLNKIDMLWDELSTPQQVKAQIARQRHETAQILNLPEPRVLALSAHKGLLAKVRDDAQLLQDSGLPAFEDMLSTQLLGSRQQMLEQVLESGVKRLQAAALRVLGVQRRELLEQLHELRSLRGKNTSVIRHMHQRVSVDKSTFDQSVASVVAVRSVHVKLLREIFALLSPSNVRQQMGGLSEVLQQPGLKLGLRQAYDQDFEKLSQVVQRVDRLLFEIHEMIAASFRKLNTEHGFSLQVPTVPDIMRYEADLQAVQTSHAQYLGVGNMMQLVRAEFSDKLSRALRARVRAIFETVLGEVELWNKSISGQLDIELRERRRALSRRLEAIERIQAAAGSLEQRLSELTEQQQGQQQTEEHLAALVDKLLQPEPSSGLQQGPSAQVAAA